MIQIGIPGTGLDRIYSTSAGITRATDRPFIFTIDPDGVRASDLKNCFTASGCKSILT